MLELALADWVVILGSVLLALGAGLRAANTQRKGKGADHSRDRDSTMDYILAGRSLTAPMFAVTLIATWYGGVLGSGEFIARYGVVMILCFGLPYYIMAALYAVFLSKRIRSADAVSIPDQMRRTYGESVGIAAAVIILVISIPAPYMLTVGLVIQSITGWDLAGAVVVGALVSLAIVAKGGLRSDVHANIVQLVVMYAGFAALLVFFVLRFDGPAAMWDRLPTMHQEPTGTLGWMAVAAWFLIAMQTFIDPNFHVRAAAARTPRAAQRGLFMSIVGWMIFDGLQLMTGLYAVAYAPAVQPADTYLHAAGAVLPTVWKGLFIASVLAAAMSTLDGYALVSSTMIGHDIIDRIKGGGHRKSSLLYGLLITGVVGIVASLALPSIVDLIFYAASIAVPCLLIPLLVSLLRGKQAGHHTAHASHAPKAPFTSRILIWMIVPGIIAVATLITNMLGITNIEPMFTGIIASLLLTPYSSLLASRS